MASFSVEIKNLDKVLKDFEQFGKKAEDAVWFGMERTAIEVKDEAVRQVPKVTSTLARSIQITDRNREELSLVVSTNTEYARAVEFGFNGSVKSHQREIKQAFGRPIAPVIATVRAHRRFSRPQPYMEPAAQLGQRRIRQNVLAELNALQS